MVFRLSTRDDELERRDIKLMLLMCEGKTTQQIARLMHMSGRAVEGRLNALKAANNAKNKAQLAFIAGQHYETLKQRVAE